MNIAATTPVQAHTGFGGVGIANQGGQIGIGRATYVGADFSVRAGIGCTPPKTAQLDAAQGAALANAVKAFLDTNPGDVIGNPQSLVRDGVESTLNITWDGNARTIKVYSDADFNGPLGALFNAVNGAGNLALGAK